jgi:Plasmid pRiA4b ORF-3-like protein
MPWVRPTAVQLPVTLLDIEPAIWRQLVVPWNFHLGQLHQVIQAAFGWWDSHLHEFTIGGLRYGDPEQVGEPDLEDDARAFDEIAVRLHDFGRAPDRTFLYVYDFGDNWQHRITLERPIAIDPAPRTASCIAGARARPPEDVGCTRGYERFLEIIADPDHPEHRETLTWCGGRFDPEAFDLDRTNRHVTAALRSNRRIRRQQ